MNKLICIPTIVIVTSVHQFLQLRRLELDHCSLSVALATCVVRDILPLRVGYGGLYRWLWRDNALLGTYFPLG